MEITRLFFSFCWKHGEPLYFVLFLFFPCRKMEAHTRMKGMGETEA